MQDSLCPIINMLKITAEEVNFLICQYLDEAGYKHSAFTFRQESKLPEDSFSSSNIPPGMLLMYLEKALLLLQMETHLDLDEDVIVCNQPFTLLSPHICGYPRANIVRKQEEPALRTSPAAMQDIRAEQPSRAPEQESNTEERKQSSAEEFKGLRLLKGHKGSVYNLAWHPNKRILASGGGDNTARLWTGETPDTSGTALRELRILPQVNFEEGSKELKQIDVTSLDWSAERGFLVTGGNDGMARIWNEAGAFAS